MAQGVKVLAAQPDDLIEFPELKCAKKEETTVSIPLSTYLNSSSVVRSPML